MAEASTVRAFANWINLVEATLNAWSIQIHELIQAVVGAHWSDLGRAMNASQHQHPALLASHWGRLGAKLRKHKRKYLALQGSQ